jgi:hypothetical protein
MKLSPFQKSILEVPEHLNLALLGARGGGKTTGAGVLAFEHLDKYGENASVLIVRQTYKSLTDFEDELLLLANSWTEGSHTYNRTDKVLRWKGGSITLAAIEHTRDYKKYQGRNATLLIVDEVTLFSSERVLRLLRSNLRAPKDVSTRIVYLGNPGGPLHGRIYDRHIKDRQSHVPYTLPIDDADATEPWITLLSGPTDNPFIDTQAYIQRLREACHGDSVRLQQWLFGDWTQGEGLMFPTFNSDIHVLTDLPPRLDKNLFRVSVAMDWGISSPSVGLLGGIAKRDLTLPDGRSLPAQSVILYTEATDAIFGEDDLSKSSEWPPDRIAERLANACANYGVRKPNLVVDNARGLSGDSVQSMIQQTGLFWNVTLPNKGRRSEGWADVASRLQAAAEKNPARPHLYFTDECRYLLATLPSAVRDERNPDDWADTPHCPDHGGDALRYLLAGARIKPASSGKTVGLY